MKKILALCIAFVAIAGTTVINAQTLDEVLDEHFDAMGQKKLKKVESVTTIGKLNQQGMEIPFTQTSMRPNKLRIEGTFQGISFIQTFNGTEGWTLNPFAGSTEAQPMAEDEIKPLKMQADLDGMLYNWKDKGYTVTLEGSEDVEGTDCYKIKVVTADNQTYTHFMDKDSYMLIKTNSKITMMGTEVVSDSYYSNYMQVDGIAFPGKIENRYNGVSGETIVIDSVELDKVTDPAMFEKPVMAAAPTKE